MRFDCNLFTSLHVYYLTKNTNNYVSVITKYYNDVFILRYMVALWNIVITSFYMFKFLSHKHYNLIIYTF